MEFLADPVQAALTVVALMRWFHHGDGSGGDACVFNVVARASDWSVSLRLLGTRASGWRRLRVAISGVRPARRRTDLQFPIGG